MTGKRIVPRNLGIIPSGRRKWAQGA